MWPRPMFRKDLLVATEVVGGERMGKGPLSLS